MPKTIEKLKRVRILTVDFSEKISAIEISKFRGAIINQVQSGDRNTLLFHNHLENGGLRTKYPLIQYKRYREKAQIVCIDAGVDEINQLFSANSFSFTLGNRTIETEVEGIRLKTHLLQLWDKMMVYKTRDWLALNQKNYFKYRNINDDLEKKTFLESILIGNILSMAKGLDWHVADAIQLKIDTVERTKTLQYRNTEMIGFDVVFKTNVSLPARMGVGKGASVGFGTIQNLRNRN